MYDNQINLLKDKFQNYIQFDNNLNFEEIVELIHTQLNNLQENEQVLNQQIHTLQNECQTLEQELKDSQYRIDLLKNNFELISNENEQLKQNFNELQDKNDLLMNNYQNLTNQSSPFVYQDNLKQTRRAPIQEVRLITLESLIYFSYALLRFKSIQ